MNSVDIKLYDIFRKDLNLNESKAGELVQTLNEAVQKGHEDNMQVYPTKEFVKDEFHRMDEFVRDKFHRMDEFVKDEFHRMDVKLEQTKSETTKAIFWASLIQFLAIVGSVIGIISFMLRK